MSIFKNKNIGLQDRFLFFKEFARLYQSGLSILVCLQLLTQLQDKPALNQQIHLIKEQLEAGQTLQQAVTHTPQLGCALTRHLMIIGESTGTLDQRLSDIADFLQQRYQLQQQIKKIIFYPMLVLIFGLLTFMWLIIFIVPWFAELFKASTDQLPLMTCILFASSLHLRTYGIYYLLFALTAAGACLYQKNNVRQRLIPALTALPILCKLTRLSHLQQFAAAFHTCYKAGIHMDQALQLCASEHPSLHTATTHLSQRLATGVSLSTAFAESTYFPAVFQSLIYLGEASGTLEESLEQLHQLFAHKLQQQLHYLTQMLEPLIITGLGVLIGGLVLSMYLPIFKLGNVL